MSGKSIYVSILISPTYNTKASNIFDECDHKTFSDHNTKHSFDFDPANQIYVHHFTDEFRSQEIVFVIGKSPEKTKQATYVIQEYLSGLQIGKASIILLGLHVNATKLKDRLHMDDCGLEFLPHIVETYFELISVSFKNLNIRVERVVRAVDAMREFDLNLRYKVGIQEDVETTLVLNKELPVTDSEVTRASHYHKVYFGIGEDIPKTYPSYTFRTNVRLRSVPILAHVVSQVTLLDNKEIKDPRLLLIGKKLKGALLIL